MKPLIPTQKELEPMLEMDRDEKKLDVFLALHKKTLTVANLKVILSLNGRCYVKTTKVPVVRIRTERQSNKVDKLRI